MARAAVGAFSPRVLIVYSTVDGHTRTICERLRATLVSAGRAVSVRPLEDAGAADLAACEAVVVGASIRYGHHRPGVHAFVETHAALLAARPGAFFSVNLVARKPGKDRAETNPYVRKFLAHVRWRPELADVFAGRLDYPRCGRVDRCVIRLIMALTGGPTEPHAVVEFTDWARVDDFARRVAALPLRAACPA